MSIHQMFVWVLGAGNSATGTRSLLTCSALQLSVRYVARDRRDQIVHLTAVTVPATSHGE